MFIILGHLTPYLHQQGEAQASTKSVSHDVKQSLLPAPVSTELSLPRWGWEPLLGLIHHRTGQAVETPVRG